jgi:Zn-dependent protease with chaperone function
VLGNSIRNLAPQSTGLALYAFTLGAHFLCGFVRGLLAFCVLWTIGALGGWAIPANTLALIVGYGPLSLSLLCLICPPLVAPLTGRWWEMTVGGRPPERDEAETFHKAFAHLQRFDASLRLPRHWFVSEHPGTNAAVYGSTMRVDRGLLESPFTAAVIAHELGHLRSLDGRLCNALNILLLKEIDTPELFPILSLPFRILAWVASGQAACWLTGTAWEVYWRSRELAADAYAARLGQGEMLALSLRRDSLPHERPIRRMRFSRATHPYTKPRIARLNAMHAALSAQGGR